MEIMVTIMGIISTIFTFSNTYFAFRLNRTKLEMEQAEINRKKEAEEAEKKRSSELDTKLDIRNTIVLKELETVKALMNVLSGKVDATNTRLDESDRKHNQHIHESDRISKFLEMYNKAYDHSLEFFSIPDEKYKLILSQWGDKIREFGLRFINNKYGTISDSLIEFDPETSMEGMIEGFYSLCKSLVCEKCDSQGFEKWVKVKNIHSRSSALALNIKKLNLTNGELNKAVSTYFVDFSKAYSHAVGKWIEILNKKAA